MKFFETSFDDYVSAADAQNLHSKLSKTIARFPTSIADLRNLIFFGPSGVGKYTQALRLIANYSPTRLKHSRPVTIVFEKQSHKFKASDIHFEVDMALLGVKSKLLWHDIYQHVVEIVSLRPEKTAIIMCKNVHEIHSELLDNFYSYLQQTPSTVVSIKFVLITEHISFLSDAILDCCEIIPVARPTKAAYNRCLAPVGCRLPVTMNVSSITNIKNLRANNVEILQHRLLAAKLIAEIRNPNTLKFLKVRSLLYKSLTQNIDFLNIICEIFKEIEFTDEQMLRILLETYKCLKFYNNNYRPIFHLERFIYYIISELHGYEP